MAILAPLATAAPESIWTTIARLRQRDVACLAPKFREAVEAALCACRGAGLDAYVFESCRTNELQAIYFQQGASKAQTALRSWHFYGLAVDVISRESQWAAWDDPAWSRGVVAAFKRQGCDWGGDWTSFRDLPHFQWGRCKPSPSDTAITLYRSGGVPAVWRAVGAA